MRYSRLLCKQRKYPLPACLADLFPIAYNIVVLDSYLCIPKVLNFLQDSPVLGAISSASHIIIFLNQDLAVCGLFSCCLHNLGRQSLGLVLVVRGSAVLPSYSTYHGISSTATWFPSWLKLVNSPEIMVQMIHARMACQYACIRKWGQSWIKEKCQTSSASCVMCTWK